MQDGIESDHRSVVLKGHVYVFRAQPSFDLSRNADQER